MSAIPSGASRVAVPQEIHDKITELANARRRKLQADKEETILEGEIAQELEILGARNVQSTEATVWFSHRQYYAKISPAKLREELKGEATQYLYDVVDEAALEKQLPATYAKLRIPTKEGEVFNVKLKGEPEGGSA